MLEIILVGIGTIATVIAAVYTIKAYSNSKRDKSKPKDNFKTNNRQKIEIQQHISKPSTESQVSSFDDSIYRNWLAEETGYIDIRGIKIGTTSAQHAMRFSILDLYTDLNVQKGLTNWDLDQGLLIGNQRIQLTSVIESTRCLAIMGDPGSGKTTFLRYIARKQIEKNGKQLPFFIELPEIYQFALSKKKYHVEKVEGAGISLNLKPTIIIDFILEFSKRENLNLNQEGLLKKIGNGECMLLFDSLDELPSASARENFVDTITKASRRWDKCKFLITSRPIALTGKAIPIGFEVVGIDSFQKEEIKKFIDKWSSLLSDSTLQKKFSDDLFSTIIENQQLRSLARNPVMLTCMAVLHFNNKHLPESRSDLIEAVIQWLIRSKEGVSRPINETPEFIEARNREIALAMFEKESGNKNRVGRKWVASNIVFHFENDENKALDFLSREENQTGLIVRRGEGDLAFWHSWFQQYLAAKEIAGKTDDEKTGWWSKIRTRLNDPVWQEIIPFVPACLNRLGSDRVDLFFERISNESLKADLSNKVKTVGFGGRILRDLLQIGYNPSNAPSWNSILNDIKPIFKENICNISLEDRYEAAVAYGLIGDKRLEKFEETWISIPSGFFLMGSQSDDKEAHNYDEFANHWEGPVIEIEIDSFEIRKYPITVIEFKSFVQENCYFRKELWSDEGWSWRNENKIEAPGNWDNQMMFLNCPVTGISWFEANAYCRWLTIRESHTSYEYRLPSEAEWEYVACRGIPPGHRFPWGNTMSYGDKAESNWGGCDLRKKSPVGMFPLSNSYDGVTDMFGNIEEWCEDIFTLSHVGYSKNGSARYIEGEERRVVRGGSTIRFMRLCRPTYRSKTYCNQRYQTIGFRVVRKSK